MRSSVDFQRAVGHLAALTWAAVALWPAAAAAAGPGPEVQRPGQVLTLQIAPAEAWDDPAGPLDRRIEGGSVLLYRPGRFVPELVEPVGAPFLLAPGDWLWRVEAEGWVSAITSGIHIPDEVLPGERSLFVPVVPACRLAATEDPGWPRVERVDVVSLDEHAVYPLVWRHRREAWVPAGRYLAYSVAGGALAGISAIESCAPGERKELALPVPPARDRQAFVATLRLPEGFERDESERLLALLEDPLAAAGGPPVAPAAAVWQGRAGSFFFLDQPAERTLALAARHPRLRSATAPIEPLGGSVREVGLGELRVRRSLEVEIDYRPARAHRIERLELLRCGDERESAGDEILVHRCRRKVAEAPLRRGPRSYVFSDLDDGQYLLSAVVDDETVAGLGRDAAPWLDPADDLPPPVERSVLEELEIYGHLLRGGEAVPGSVRLAPWVEDAGVPARTVHTDDELVYRLHYFGRYLTPGEAQHLPEPLRDRDPAELPGLYCCFAFTPCSDDGLCRPFNIHSTWSGGGRFDLELPGEETVDFTVLDAASGEPLPAARVLLVPGPAFHFHEGEAIWAEALGMEPESLRVGADGRARWASPGPGSYPAVVTADGYESVSRRIELAAGEELAIEVRLTPEPPASGAWLGFADGRPVADAALLPFDAEGRPRHDCRTGTDGQGRVALAAGCRDLTYLVVHPGAALAALEGADLAGRAGIEVRERPAFPLRLRVVDGDGRGVSAVAVQVRLGELTITPDDLLAGAPSRLPWERTNAAGEIVLFGVDPGAPGLVEVAPWGEWEGDWVTVTGADLAAGRPLEMAAQPAAASR